MITVLIIEDYDGVYIPVRWNLEQAGFEVKNTEMLDTVSGAVSAIVEHRPDVVILDHNLKNKGCGTEVVAEILKKNISTKFVVHTTDWYPDSSICKKYAELGVTLGVRKMDFKNMIREIYEAAGVFQEPPSSHFHKIPYSIRLELFSDFLINLTAIDLELQLLQEKLQNAELGTIQQKLFTAIEQLRDFALKEEK